MAGDYSRIAQGLHQHYAAVLMQQGRTHLDADWNTMAWLTTRRDETQAADTFGAAAVPAQTTPNGFFVTVASGGTDLAIGAGRCYVDGIQAELFTDETVNGKPVTYLNQPFDPAPAAIGGSGLVYLDVWKREVTWVEDPALLEIALGGPDTTTRIQTAWQVKLLPDTGNLAAPLSCGTDLGTLLPASAGRIATQAVAPVMPADPCILPDQGGYRGIENRLYRVQIHLAGDLAGARWKWSRENASVVSRVTAIVNAGSSCKLSVDRIGRDAVLRFRANDWVEIIDDTTELAGMPGTMAKIAGPPDETTRSITLDRPLPASFDATIAARHTRIIRWDQSQDVDADGLLPIGTGWMELEDGVQVALTLDSAIADGQFHVADHWCFAARTADASVQVLDHAPPLGIHHHYTVLASYSSGAGGLSVDSDCRTLWPPAMPTEDGCGCAVCVDAPAHNAGSATIEMAVEKVRASGGRICLGPGVFNLGATLMLKGLKNVTLSGQGPATMLLFSGHGPALWIDAGFGVRVEDLTVLAVATAITQPPANPTFSTHASAPDATATGGPVPITIGILVRNSVEVAIERCGIQAIAAKPGGEPPPPPAPAPDPAPTPAPPPGTVCVCDPDEKPLDPAVVQFNAALLYAATLAHSFGPGSIAIALDGFVLEVLIRDNLLIADVGVGKAALLGSDGVLKQAREVLLAANLEVLGNSMPCAMSGIAIVDSDTHEGLLSAFALEVTLSANRILGGQTAGIAIEGLALPGAAVRVERNYIDVPGAGVVGASDGLIIADNVITQAATGASATKQDAGPWLNRAAIHIGSVPGGKLPVTEVHIHGNRINAFAGPGIQIAGTVLISSVIGNAITEVVRSGILISGTGTPAEAIIRHNEVLAVLAPAGASAGNSSPTMGKVGKFAQEFLKAGAINHASTVFSLAGIEVIGIPTVVVQNNTVGLIGTVSGQPIAAVGIQVYKLDTATVSGNDISDIGQPGSLDQTGYGVAASDFAHLAASGNTIRQNSTDPVKPGSFTAIATDSQRGSATLATNAIWGHSALSLVDVGVGSDCLFNGNLCTETGSGQWAGAVVQLQGDSVIAGNNRITCERPRIALAITAGGGSTEAPPRATVVGNIAGQAIILNGSSLAAPWAPLNVIA